MHCIAMLLQKTFRNNIHHGPAGKACMLMEPAAILERQRWHKAYIMVESKPGLLKKTSTLTV